MSREIISHFGHTIFLNIIEFVVFADNNLLASRYEFFLDLVAKVVIDIAVGEGVHVDFVIFEPLHRFVELVVLSLEVFELQLLAQNHLVEGSREISID